MVISNILKNYSHNNASVKNNIAKLLNHGKLGGTGKLLILPVDQGFEHGPQESFSKNEDGYNPEYHVDLAVEAGLSAYAAPIGMIEDISYKYSAKIPLILKLNSATKLFPKESEPEQAFIATPKDALNLGCIGVGITLYPGSAKYKEMLEKTSRIIKEAKDLGLFVVVWSYPRGGDLGKEDEVAIDVVSYGAHIACLIGADIIKVKPPINHIAIGKKEDFHDISLLKNRVSIIKKSCFASKRLLLLSGGKTKDVKELYSEIKSIKDGGADGSIIGRNVFQRERNEAMKMLNNVVNIYLET